MGENGIADNQTENKVFPNRKKQTNKGTNKHQKELNENKKELKKIK